MNGRTCVTQSLNGLSDFCYDKELGVYMYPMAARVEDTDGEEGYIIETLNSVKDLTAYSRELTYYIRDWQSRYHLSPMRNNLLEGIVELLDKKSTVLEIGAECGAITRWLGERFKEVDAMEEDLRSAVAARTRTSGLENVKVYVGNVLNSSPEKKYDIITLIGALAKFPLYDGRTSDPCEPCIHLLSRLNESLNERGILVLAIENKLGAKYLSGCSEEHTGKPFLGVEGYPERSPVTFSRNELESILRKSGFHNIQFYHLFPDHKLTSTIMPEHDETLALKPYNWIKTPFEDYTGPRQHLLLEPLFLKTITDAGLLWQFSNSFLVLASRSENVNLQTSWLIKKFNNESHDGKFRHQVILEKENGSKYTIKRTPAPGNQPCIDVQGIGYRLENEEYVYGEHLALKLYRALLEDEQGPAIKRTIKTLHDSMIMGYSTGRADEGGYPLIRGDAVDYTLWNIISADDGALHFVDRKWRINRDIPADFVLFRNLLYIFNGVHPFLKEKSRPWFIIDNIRAIYPQYTPDRLKYNVGLEGEFQSVVSNKKTIVYIDKTLIERAGKAGIIFQKLKSALRTATKQNARHRMLKKGGDGGHGHKACAAKRS